MTERRRFSRKERNTLYRSSGGVCASCGEPLATGWHADHRIPYSIGGHTRLSNGQALCPTCNTKKGSSMDWRDTFKPRHFQRELIQATRARAVAGEAVTVALVWPGSGKTLSYQAVATELMRLDLIDFVAVFTPRVVLAKQAELDWRNTHGGNYRLFDERNRLEWLLHRGNVAPLLPPGKVRYGYVSTYQSLVSDPELHLDWAQRHRGRFLLIGDEAQFLGAPMNEDDENSPKAGQIFEKLADYARHTLLLSGTPDRADGRPLILCGEFYDTDDRGRMHLRPHVKSGYREGIAHRYLREFDAAIHDCKVTWWPNGAEEPIEYTLSQSSELPKDKRAKLSQILRKPEVWQSMCDTTVQRLRYMQKINPSYKALVACMEVNDARKAERYLKDKYPNLRVLLSVSEDGPAAEAALRDFKVKAYDVLVTVRKAFIGYDCPQITVVCVLTNYRHFGHLTQLVFRGGRVWDPKLSRHPADKQVMHLIVPDDPAMQKFIEYLRNEQAEGLKIRERDDRQPVDGPVLGGLDDEGRLEAAYVTEVRGATLERDLTPEEYAAAQAKLDEMGPITTPEQLLSLFESMGVRLTTPEPVANQQTPETDGELTNRFKSEAAKYIGQWLRERQHDPDDDDYRRVRRYLTRRINDSFGIQSTTDLTTADEARRYLEHVKRFLSQWGQV